VGASSFRYLCLIPAQIIIEEPTVIPDVEGVFYVFVDGGSALLDATGYFANEPLTHDRSVHLYTGAARRLRPCIERHLFGAAANSSLKRTLLAIEAACGGLSATINSGTPSVTDESLTDWLTANAQFAYVPCQKSHVHLSRLLRSIVSPLNLKQQKTPEYATQLRQWRREFGLTRTGTRLNEIIANGALAQ
jgi:hypothetical protein